MSANVGIRSSCSGGGSGASRIRGVSSTGSASSRSSGSSAGCGRRTGSTANARVRGNWIIFGGSSAGAEGCSSCGDWACESASLKSNSSVALESKRLRLRARCCCTREITSWRHGWSGNALSRLEAAGRTGVSERALPGSVSFSGLTSTAERCRSCRQGEGLPQTGQAISIVFTEFAREGPAVSTNKILPSQNPACYLARSTLLQ